MKLSDEILVLKILHENGFRQRKSEAKPRGHRKGLKPFDNTKQDTAQRQNIKMNTNINNMVHIKSLR